MMFRNIFVLSIRFNYPAYKYFIRQYFCIKQYSLSFRKQFMYLLSLIDTSA